MRAYLFVLLVAAAVTYLTTPAARRFARRIGAVAPIRERDVHTVPIPRLGGTAIYLGVAIAILTASRVPFFDKVFQDQGRAAHAVLLSAGAVCLLGVLDDLWQLDAVTKFAGQALAAGLIAWQGLTLLSLPIFGTFIPSHGVLLVITVIAIVITINAVNFVDGLDGLAAGMVAIAGSAFFVYSYLLTRQASPGDYSSLASLIIAALVGACLGFLPHNINPARIFMGDSGSMLLGLMLATSTMAITGTVQPAVLAQARIVPAFIPLVLPLAVLALPLIDLGLAVVRRTRAGKMPWQPDKMHLHHRMLGLGHSHARAVLILYFWTATVGFGVALFALVRPFQAFVIGGISVVTALILTIGPLRGRRTDGPAPAVEAVVSVSGPDQAIASGTDGAVGTPDGAVSATSTPDGAVATSTPDGAGRADLSDETEMNSGVGRG
jgi:UDP-GlcNAc:undecaprenyl-phosphate/decaprenyl-phosphate GlcNAc-1-phosphate transferase